MRKGAPWLGPIHAPTPYCPLSKRADAHLFEPNASRIAMILEAEIAFIGSNATFGFIPSILGGHGLALGVVGNDRTIEFNDGSGAIQSDEEGVPLSQLGVHGVL